jgi:hypothetical protein
VLLLLLSSKNGINITSNLTKTILKQLYLDNVISVSDKPIGENSSSSEVVSNELMGSNSQISEVAEISTLMNGKEEDGTPFIVAVAELVAKFKP